MPVIIIRLYVENFDQNIQKMVFKGLKECLKAINVDAQIKLAHQEVYWKNNTRTECIYHIFYRKWIPVKEIANKFDLSWSFCSSEAYISKNDIACEFSFSEAMWDKRFDGKCFIHENVKWVLIEDNHFDFDIEYD